MDQKDKKDCTEVVYQVDISEIFPIIIGRNKLKTANHSENAVKSSGYYRTIKSQHDGFKLVINSGKKDIMILIHDKLSAKIVARFFLGNFCIFCMNPFAAVLLNTITLNHWQTSIY